MTDHVTMRKLLFDDAPNAAAGLRATLESLPAHDRDAWLDRVFDVDPLAGDGRGLPRGCVPYLPCAVDLLLQMVDHAQIGDRDVFVDIGSGVGRAAALVHCLTGAGAIGIEIQPDLVLSARALALRLNKPRIATIQGDAAELLRLIQIGTVFFLYCPFSGKRFDDVVDELHEIAMTRPIRLCCVGLPIVDRPWIERISPDGGELVIYRSVAYSSGSRRSPHSPRACSGSFG